MQLETVSVAVYGRADQVKWTLAAGEAQYQADAVRPHSLKGKFMNLDMVSLACARAAEALRRSEDWEDSTTGVLLATRNGNASIRTEFMDLLAQRRISPARFAASGFNACTSVIAVTAGVTGPSAVLVGEAASFPAVVRLAAARLRAGTVKSIIVGQCEHNIDTDQAGCVLALYSRDRPVARPDESGQRSIRAQIASAVNVVRDRVPELVGAFDAVSRTCPI